LSSDADASEIAKEKNKYYEIIRDARIENDRKPTAHLFPSIASVISGSGTLGRRSASTRGSSSLCTSSLSLSEYIEFLIGVQDLLIRNFRQLPGVKVNERLSRVEVVLHATKDLLESVEGTALESFPCFSAYKNESVDVVFNVIFRNLPRARSAVICLLMTCSM
jgi:hypothetical protein